MPCLDCGNETCTGSCQTWAVSKRRATGHCLECRLRLNMLGDCPMCSLASEKLDNPATPLGQAAELVRQFDITHRQLAAILAVPIEMMARVLNQWVGPSPDLSSGLSSEDVAVLGHLNRYWYDRRSFKFQVFLVKSAQDVSDRQLAARPTMWQRLLAGLTEDGDG
jgi:hypothetical protein